MFAAAQGQSPLCVLVLCNTTPAFLPSAPASRLAAALRKNLPSMLLAACTKHGEGSLPPTPDSHTHRDTEQNRAKNGGPKR
ncbi:hypothetical protein E2C01_040862 [Portunus trituberculatus]|uniref:Uncharacterized protein n=1 Tax=Portunus trituberculatus TaxID=210409 RepID=A0A5B7FP49_PORTR|nr:hypothetical protein [Portunus trituberculatus]